MLTHCNTGALATAGYGTALGVIQSRLEAGQAWARSGWTRPGRCCRARASPPGSSSRLGIPFRLVTDNSAGALMSQGLVDRIVVGADRIAANGDTANKIGTYTVAVLAHRHDVPFYVAAPLSTIDRATPNGAGIPIEERRETRSPRSSAPASRPDDTAALNFAFDVTPAELITAIITEVGVLEPPYERSIAAAFERSERVGPIYKMPCTFLSATLLNWPKART